MSLKALIDEANVWRRITNQPEHAYPPTTREEVLHWGRAINARFEPENLTCDGELPRHLIDRKIEWLNEAYAELDKIDQWGALEEAEEFYM